jgi:hypothetical protein
MQYPSQLIARYGTAERFAEVASSHPFAPLDGKGERRTIGRDAVYQWKQRNRVPYMWQSVVASMAASPSLTPDVPACVDDHNTAQTVSDSLENRTSRKVRS